MASRVRCLAVIVLAIFEGAVACGKGGEVGQEVGEIRCLQRKHGGLAGFKARTRDGYVVVVTAREPSCRPTG